MYSILWILYLDFNLDLNPNLIFFVLSWPWVTPDVCPWSQNFCLNIINNANTQMCSLEMFSGLWIFHINVWNGNSVEQKTSLILRGKGTEQVLATHTLICIYLLPFLVCGSFCRQSWIRNSSLTVLHFWRMHGTIKGGKSVQTFKNVIYQTPTNPLTHSCQFSFLLRNEICWLLVDGWIKQSGRWRRKAILGNYWTPKFRSGQRQETSSEYQGEGVQTYLIK